MRRIIHLTPRPVVGVFSSFGREICELLEPAIACILQNSQTAIVLIGPAELFVQTLVQRYPMYADRMTTTGRLHNGRIDGSEWIGQTPDDLAVV